MQSRSDWIPPPELQRQLELGRQAEEVSLSAPIAVPGAASGQHNIPHPSLTTLLIELRPLSENDTFQLASELLRDVQDLPDHVISLVSERAEGLPYYVEELVNLFFDEGVIDRSGEPWRFVASRVRESPLPVTPRRSNADRIPITPTSGETVSAIAAPQRTGGLSA